MTPGESVPGERAETAWEARSLAQTRARNEARIIERRLTTGRTIVDAAMALARETNSFGMTVKQVGDRAGISLMTLYRHFATKDHLMLALVEESVVVGTQQIRDAADTASDSLGRLRCVIAFPITMVVSPAEAVFARALVREHVRLLETFPTEIETALQSYRGLVVEGLTDAVADGVIGAVDVERTATIVLHLVSAVAQGLALRTYPGAPEDVARDVWQFCWAALHPVDLPTPTGQRAARLSAAQRKSHR